MSKNKPTPKKAKKPAIKKPNGRKTWLKVAKKVHELNKKQKLGWTWTESMRFASKNVYPNFKGKSASKVRLTDIESDFKTALTEQGQPTPTPTPKIKEICFSALNVPTEDLIEREWWTIADDDIWVNFDNNLPMRFAFDNIIDTGIIKKNQMPNMSKIREDIRKSGIKYGLVIFKVLIQPDKKDDGQPCSYYVLVTLEKSSYDLMADSEKEIIPEKSEKDLPEEEQQKREQAKIDKAKQKRSKEEAKKLNRPKQVEPKAITKSKDQPKEKSKNLDNNFEIEKIKAENSRISNLTEALKVLERDFDKGVLTKREYKKRQQQILDKFENGGEI